MNRLRAITVFAVMALLITVAATVGSAATDDAAEPAAVETEALPAGTIDLALPGTAWVAEKPWRTSIRPFGWGTRLKHKKGGSEWFHMPLALPTYVDSVARKISKVEFCAKSNEPTVVKPIKIDLWENNSRFHSSTISWPNKTSMHCHSIGFNPPVWKQSVGMSVLIQFGNTTGSVTMYKAWVRVVS
jgi:hypothetical protein